MATLSVTPSSGIVAKTTAINVNVDTAPSNDDTTFSSTAYPTEPEIVYRFRLRLAGQDDLLSNPFSTNPDGTGEWNSVLLPAAGSWELTLRDTSDDSQVATTTVTAS